MCGKFTAMATWSEVVAFSQPLGIAPDDRLLTLRVMSEVPVILWDHVAGQRRVVPMRWGFPDPANWKIPRPIHARSESIEKTKAFAGAFLDGQRGIVLVKTFNEAPDSGEQHTITPGDAGAIGIAFVWRRFEALPFAACMVTVPANALIATLPTDRMPAVLAPEDWSAWLGEADTDVNRLKACLKTVEGVNWRMEREPKREKPTVKNPRGLV